MDHCSIFYGGNGYVSEHLNINGFNTFLVEPSVSGCINGYRRGIKNIINSSFDRRYFYPESISNIGIFDVLEHIREENSFLNTIHSILIPNGRIFITVPAYQPLWSEEDVQAGHYKRYNKHELCRILEQHGFQILFRSYFFSYLVIPIFFFRTIPSLLGLYKRNTTNFKKQLSVSFLKKLIIYPMSRLEQNIINKNQTVLIGSSLMVVAKKK